MARMDIEGLFDMTGRVAIVTGGSRGLGLSIAGGLALIGVAIYDHLWVEAPQRLPLA